MRFGGKSEESNWQVVADLMTALMVIFMFIAINYILQVIEHTFVEDEIYNKLSTEFEDDLTSETIQLGPDGAIRFELSQDKDEQLFEEAEAVQTEYFDSLLADFLPRYWKVINSDSSYIDYIKEIRIEGHADIIPYYKNGLPRTLEQSYLNNLELSQQRSASILKFLREQRFYINATQEEKDRMNFLFTSIGFSNSRTLNEQGNYVYLDTNKTPENDKSRRVEFRIVTSNEKLIEKLADANDED